MKKPTPKPTDWYCPRCGTQNDEHERWCFYCKLDRRDLQAKYIELVAG